MHFIIKLIQSIIIITIFNVNFIFCQSIKKELNKNQSTVPENATKINEIGMNKSNMTIKISKVIEISTEIHPVNSLNDENLTIKSILPTLNKYDIPESFEIAFIVCIVIGIIALILLSCKAYRMRGSRAERRYGVRGDRGAQELTPLPITIDDEDSDIDDDTLFDRNRVT